MWEVYDALLNGLPSVGRVACSCKQEYWSLAQTEDGEVGLAMTIPWDQRPAIFPSGLEGLSVTAAASAVKSWNLSEAGAAMAVINSVYNTSPRLSALNCGEPYENYCTRGIDFRGKTVGLVGHLKYPNGALDGAKDIYVLERAPQPGDYPDSACDYFLPRCDVVLITGSTLINKTLPHLLELSRNAYTILTGPTVPLCPALLGCGVDRLAGMVVTDRFGACEYVANAHPGSPYKFGETFLLVKDS